MPSGCWQTCRWKPVCRCCMRWLLPPCAGHAWRAWKMPQRIAHLSQCSPLKLAECSFDSFFDTSILLPQGQIEQAQIVAAEARPGPCFFATFWSAQAAAYAAQLNLNPLQERMMRWVGGWVGALAAAVCAQMLTGGQPLDRYMRGLAALLPR